MLNKFFIIRKWLFILFMLFPSYFCVAQHCDAELINQQTVVDISKGKLLQTYSFEIRINNRDGDKYAEVSIPFNRMNKVFGIDAAIIDNSGKKVQELKKNDITEHSEYSDMSFYTDSYVKEFKLRNHTYPYTLKYSYRIESSQFMFLTHWLPVIDNNVPTLEASLTLNVPLGYKLKYHSNRLDSPKIDTLQVRMQYKWQASYTNPVSSENWSPSLLQYFPYIEIVPENFMYENEGSHENWITFGNWNLSLLKGMDDLPESEKVIIHSLTDTILGEKEKIRKLFHYLQDATRYINVSIKTGGMKPYPASYVAEKKYGDCKALANYFKSCLSVISINSFYTTINAGAENEPIDTAVPSQQFNHIILYIPLKQDTLWVDCTSDLAFGYLGTFTQNRLALVLSNDASALVMTPKLSFEDVQEKRKIIATISPSGELKANYRNIYRGNKYEIISTLKTELNETQRRQYINDRVIDDGFQLGTYTISNPERDIPEIILEFTASSGQMLKEYGNESLLKIIPLRLLYLEEPKKRKLPVQINYPILKIDSSEYLIPENYKTTTIPQNRSYHSKYGDYQVSFLENGKTVTAVKQIKINPGTYPIAEYPDFYSFIMKILESENSFYITLTKS